MNDALFEMQPDFLADDGVGHDHDVYLVGCSSFHELTPCPDADLDDDDFVNRPCLFSDAPDRGFKYGALVHCKDCLHC